MNASQLSNVGKKYFLAAALAGVLYLGATQRSFGQNLVLNPLFTADTEDVAGNPNGGGLGDQYTLTDWSSTGYNFLFINPNAGDDTVQGPSGGLSMWGPNSGSSNGLRLSPAGGNDIAADGAYDVGPISQVINGLTVGKTYQVTFLWAGAQQSGYFPATTEQWYVDLSGTTGLTNANIMSGGKATSVVNNAAEGFTGWMQAGFYFTATGTQETLYFLANGTPNGQPPFSLLSDVSLTLVPEPKASSSWALLFGVLIMVGNQAWRRYKTRTPTNT